MSAPRGTEDFDRLLHAMATIPLSAVEQGTPAEACPTSDAGNDACCDDTQTPKDTSGDALS